MISPKDHPQTAGVLSVGALSTFLVAELHNRAGIDITLAEGTYIVVILTALYFFAQGKIKQ